MTRTQIIAITIDTYLEARNTGTDTLESHITDLITDLLLYAAEQCEDAESVSRMALNHYRSEIDDLATAAQEI